MGRPSLNVKMTGIRLDDGVGERIDALMGPNRRAQYVRKAVLEALERDERKAAGTGRPPPPPPVKPRPPRRPGIIAPLLQRSHDEAEAKAAAAKRKDFERWKREEDEAKATVLRPDRT